jgi:prepilin-type N-terminal cleavage/methylation domain-containing protein
MASMLSRDKVPMDACSRGFTLLEVAVAILVFCIGFIAMNRMQAIAVRGNAYNMQLTEATNVMKSTAERLMDLPQESDSMGGALPLDGSPHFTSPAVNVQGYDYSPEWLVSQVPGVNLKQVHIIVTWNDTGVPHNVFVDLYK